MRSNPFIRFGKFALLTLIVSCVCAMIFPPIATADQWSPGLTVPPNSDGVSFVDNYQWSALSSIVANPLTSSNSTDQVECSNFTATGPCALNSNGTSGTVTALLPVCASGTSTNCVASMALGTSADSLVPSTFVSAADDTSTPGDPSLGVPGGSSVQLWTNPLTNLGATNTYATFVEAQFLLVNGQVSSATLNAAIYPYNEIQGTYFAPFLTLSQGSMVVEGGEIECAFTTATSCGRLEDFPIGTQASLSIRVSNLVGGWFKGRLHQPIISESPFDATSNTISVNAGVVTVPTLSYVATTAQVQSDPSLSKFFADLGFPPPPIAAGTYVRTDSPVAFTALNDIRDAVGNVASGQITVWNFGTLPAWSSVAGENASCLNNNSEVEGFVTTNAMAFQSDPPSLNGGYFTYDVAGMHFNADGSVIQGTYDLVMKDSVAQCLYGFTKAPISATVNITEGSTSVESVATTTVQDSDGWLHIGAYGFNFSNPSITVHLIQHSLKKTAIACVSIRNHHVHRTVRAVRPRCPVGYRKV